VATSRADASATGGRPLVDELADRIRAEVMTGRLEIGARLPQESLASDFEVSRTPVREALRKLESEGLIEVIPNRGAIVRGPTAQEIREAYLVRAELEGLAAALAAEWISSADLTELEEADALFRACAAATGVPTLEATVQWTKANDAFHEVIQRAAGNGQLRRAIVGLHRTFPRSLTGAALTRDTRLMQRNVAEHARILDAISAHDGEEARRAMTEHVRRSGEIVAQWFERERDRHPGDRTTRNGTRRTQSMGSEA
jgi:DNA-binding GntR family transcriptional regulator